MEIREIIWLDRIIDKLAGKHHVEPYEVKETLSNDPVFKLVENGERPDEHLYAAMGRTDSGRRLIVFFIYKKQGRALIISARDLTNTERKKYEKKS